MDVRKSLQPYATGGFSAVFASICVQPMDLTKTRMQLLPRGTSLFAVAGGIVSKEGVLGLYAGLSASIMRQAVYGTARIGLHREFSDKIKESQGGANLSAVQSSGSAMLAGALASIVGTPADVALVRMQADGMKPVAERRGYSGVFNALKRIATEEGVARLWQGFEPTAARAIAMNVGMLACYDQAKQAITKVRGCGHLSVALISSLHLLTLLHLFRDTLRFAAQWRESNNNIGIIGYSRDECLPDVASFRHDKNAPAKHEAGRRWRDALQRCF